MDGMSKISEVRFNMLAGYARDPMALVYGEELAFYENTEGNLLGLVIRDRADSDFAGIVFGRDAKLRFRWTSMTAFVASKNLAITALSVLFAKLALAEPDFHVQGDEIGKPVDFFEPVHAAERLNPDFRTVMMAEEFAPARSVIEPMMRWHEDVDGNFIEQFQSTAFDQRIWELYLFAMLTEAGFAFDSSNAAPDFDARGLHGRVLIEAVTVGPTRNGGDVIPPPPRDTPEQAAAYLN